MLNEIICFVVVSCFMQCVRSHGTRVDVVLGMQVLDIAVSVLFNLFCAFEYERKFSVTILIVCSSSIRTFLHQYKHA